jgi:formamidopyrimidine-DNA glycosylase
VPELPDLLHVVSRLRERLNGREVVSERVKEPVVLRFTVRGNLSLLLDRSLRDVFRKSHFVVFRFDGLDLAVNPMLAGRFRFSEVSQRDEAALAFALGFSSGTGEAAELELRYIDDKTMGKAYLIANDDWKAVPGMQTGGVEILAREFTAERFSSLLKHRRDQVRVFLLDKKALDSIGNAYADEILFEARLHPKTFCRSLSHEEALRLHGAIVKVMTEAAAEVAARDEPIEVKVRDFLKVRLRDACPSCGSKIRKAGVRGMDAYFCPRCQPATRPGFVDWRKTGR